MQGQGIEIALQVIALFAHRFLELGGLVVAERVTEVVRLEVGDVIAAPTPKDEVDASVQEAYEVLASQRANVFGNAVEAMRSELLADFALARSLHREGESHLALPITLADLGEAELVTTHVDGR